MQTKKFDYTLYQSGNRFANFSIIITEPQKKPVYKRANPQIKACNKKPRTVMLPVLTYVNPLLCLILY